MQPYYTDDAVTLYAGDCLAVLPALPDGSVDAVVTDPPYGLGFMGKQWDQPGQYGSMRKGPKRRDITAGAVGVDHKTTTERSASMVAGDYDLSLTGNQTFGLWCSAWAAECLRVLKPGGHLLAFGGTRTWHRLAVAIEDAGFEIRDTIAWLYGSGFPKSLDVSKAIDRQRNDRPDIVRVTSWLKAQATARGFTRGEIDQHMGTSDMAGWWLTDLPHRCQCPTWEQWETLRRFMGLPDDMDAEVWRLNGRKGQPGEAWDLRPITQEETRPLVSGTTITFDQRASSERERRDIPATADAQRWQGWGTALKPAHEPVVVARKPLVGTVAANVLRWGTGALNIDGCRIGSGVDKGIWPKTGRADQRNSMVTPMAQAETDNSAGRWPANVTLDETAAAALDRMSGETVSSGGAMGGRLGASGILGEFAHDGPRANAGGLGDTGGASRFFYTAKAGSDERITHDGISHPTVKPLSLMRWLTRLVCPPGGTILEPFAGSGTTVEAAILEGFRCIAIEREADYLPLITQRLNRRRNPVAYLTAAGEDLGLFDFEEPA